MLGCSSLSHSFLHFLLQIDSQTHPQPMLEISDSMEYITHKGTGTKGYN